MGRSVKKGPFTDVHLMVKVQAAIDKNEKKVIRTWSRRSTVRPEFVGQTLAVHNGKKFIPWLRDREHGGAQAGRILSDPAVPGHSARAATEKTAKPA